MARKKLNRGVARLMRPKEVREQYGLDPKTLEKWAGMGLPVQWVDLPGVEGGRRGERRWVRESIEACLAGMGGGGGE